MAKCPILILAIVSAGFNPLYKVVDPNEKYTWLDCLKSECQMWDAERGDCGLKPPTQATVTVELIPSTPASKTVEPASSMTQAQKDIFYPHDIPNPPPENIE